MFIMVCRTQRDEENSAMAVLYLFCQGSADGMETVGHVYDCSRLHCFSGAFDCPSSLPGLVGIYISSLSSSSFISTHHTITGRGISCSYRIDTIFIISRPPSTDITASSRVSTLTTSQDVYRRTPPEALPRVQRSQTRGSDGHCVQ
jgi:hypothetical protein